MAASNLPPVAILAGGLATRLRPLTQTIPKSMIGVAGQPFIAHQLRLLAAQGFTDIVLCCGHLGEQIEAFVGDGAQFSCRVRYSADGDRLRGTGGALRRALGLLGSRSWSCTATAISSRRFGRSASHFCAAVVWP